MNSNQPLHRRGGGQVHHNHQSFQVSDDTRNNMKEVSDPYDSEIKNGSNDEFGGSSKTSTHIRDEEQPPDGDVEKNPSNSIVISIDSQSNSFYVGLYSFIFFISTIVHNLVVEGASELVASSPFEGALMGSAATLFQCACCFLLPLSLDRNIQRKNVLIFRPHTLTLSELRPYLQLTILVMITANCANLSVAYVSYPTKVVLKSAKLIPTMIVSTFFQRKNRYSARDYIVALCLCVGAAGYSYDPSKKSTPNSTKGQQYYGILLLTVSVIMDSFLPNVQQRLMTKPTTINETKKQPLTASDLMINVNSIATISIILYMIAIEQSFLLALSYCLKHPKFFICMFFQGLTQAIGVFAYTKLIKASGPVVAVAISTLRKVVTITLSYIVFPGKPFLKVHCFAITMVLIGIILQSFWKKPKHSNTKKHDESTKETIDHEKQ